jgi:hypothetical protein
MGPCGHENGAMNSSSSIAGAFRLIFRHPAIALAEIAWRSSFAAAAWLLGGMFLIESLKSLPVTRPDRLLLTSHQPVFILRALERIFADSAVRITKAGIVLLVGLALAWIAAASLGRFAILDSLLDEFQLGSARPRRGAWASLVALNTLRFALVLAAVIAAAGAVLVASSAWASSNLRPADGVGLFGLLLFSVGVSWIALNWLLSVAAIFPVAEQETAFDAIGSVVRLIERRTGPLVLIGLLFGGLHIGLFMAATAIGISLLVAARPLGAGTVIFLELGLIAAYMAAAHFLYVSRLAAYVSLLRREDTAVAGQSPDNRSGPDTRSRIDPDELILGDVPLAST